MAKKLTKRNDLGIDRKKQILDASTRLFAERGYHGVSTRAIAKEVGLNIATVSYHVGGKREIYRAIIKRLYEDEQSLIEGRIGDVDALLARPELFFPVVDQVIAAMVDLLAGNPARPRLYMQRWLEPRDDLTEAEAELSLRTQRALRDVLERAQAVGIVRREVDLGLFLRSFTWILFGYFVTGPIDWDHWHADPLRPGGVPEFKAYLQQYVRAMLSPAG